MRCDERDAFKFEGTKKEKKRKRRQGYVQDAIVDDGVERGGDLSAARMTRTRERTEIEGGYSRSP